MKFWVWPFLTQKLQFFTKIGHFLLKSDFFQQKKAAFKKLMEIYVNGGIRNDRLKLNFIIFIKKNHFYSSVFKYKKF